MILINLLPHREEARKRRKEAFQATMFASFLLGLAIAGAIYWWFQIMITDQQNKNAFLQQEIKVLEGQIKEIASIEDEIASLRARQKAVEDLQFILSHHINAAVGAFRHHHFHFESHVAEFGLRVKGNVSE